MKMRKSILVAVLASFLGLVKGQAQNSNEVQAVKATIVAFAKAGDQNNVQELTTYLDDNYRILMNQLFGSTEVVIMPKAIYLEKIKTKEFGGDNRKLTFGTVEINGNTASAKVIMKGEKMTFSSIILLVKNNQGKWKLISDTPVI